MLAMKRIVKALDGESARRLAIAGLFLFVALLFGGGGSPAPFAELIVQIAALVALGLWFWPQPTRTREPLDRTLWLCAGALVLIPIIQLVPVPPVVWTNLPGRENVVAAITFIGREDEWRPISIAPARTVASLLSLIPPLAMMWFASQLRTHERTRLLWVVAGVGLVSAILATLQVGTGNVLIFYQPDQPTPPPGIMASRNAQGDLLICAMLAVVALAALPHPRVTRTARLAIAAVVLLVLASALVLSGSRAGFVMLIIPVAAAARLWWVRPAPTATVDQERKAGSLKAGNKRWLLISGAALLALAGIGTIARDNAVISRTLDRFSATTDARFNEIWPDAVVAAQVMWPAGGGMGTFIPAFESVESLEVVNESEPNRAHNDYLEFVIEAGLAALLLIGAAFAVLGLRAVQAFRATRRTPAEPLVVFSTAALLVVAFHSLVDYPLRAMTVAVIAGFAVGSLGRCTPDEKGSRG